MEKKIKKRNGLHKKTKQKKPPETHQIFNDNILDIIIKNINKINYFLMSQ
jgi:hypothetical protein